MVSDTLTLYSWNVNGIRAGIKKGFWDWLDTTQPDVVGLQETKISGDQLTLDMVQREGYHTYWAHAEKRGYSGVAVFTKEKPDHVEYGLGIERFDDEGRVLVLDFPTYTYYTIYFPNGQRGDDRLQYKMDFYDAFLAHAEAKRAEGKNVVVCGDVNTAHQDIDLARPKENRKVSGFLPIECEWMDKWVNAGYIDTFRHFYPNKPDEYSWWNVRSRARDRNVGWRIDYFFTNNEMRDRLVDAKIHQDVMGSDHCPVSLTIKR